MKSKYIWIQIRKILSKSICLIALIWPLPLISQTFEGLKTDFLNPPLEFHPRPLWFWNNTTVSKDGIRDQMEKYNNQCGYGGFGILPFGMLFKPEYLSDEYFAVYESAIQKAQELGMKPYYSLFLIGKIKK